MVNPQYVEVEANSEEQAVELVRNSIEDLRLRDFVRLQVCKIVEPD